MKRIRPVLPYLAALAFVTTSIQIASAQFRPFERYNFEEGGYLLAGVFEHHDDHAVQKKLGEFYVDDKEVLKSIQKAWNFPREQKIYACGYHYYVVLLKNGKRVDDLAINLDCQQIVTDKGSRYFDARLLTRFSTQLKPLLHKTNEFRSVDEARDYWNKAISDSSFVYARPPKWLKYDGSFRFRSQCPTKNENCHQFGKDADILAEVRAKIIAEYPDEPFELITSGGSGTGEIYFEITCNRSLEAKFDIFDRWNREIFGKWAPFHLYLDSYWK